MAIAFRAAGVAKKVASGALTSTGLPTGHTTNDILLAVITGSDNVTVSLAGWTALAQTNNGTRLRQTILWKRDGGAETAPSFAHTGGNSAVARIFAFSGANTGATPFPTVGTPNAGSGATGATSATVTASSITPSFTNSAVIIVGSEAVNFTDGIGSNEWASYSGTNPTFTEIGDEASLTGANEAGQGTAWGLSTGGATGSRTIALSGTSTPQTSTAIDWLATMLELSDSSPTSGAAAGIPDLGMALTVT